MNYFELFEIPVQLKADPSLLREKYLVLSRKYHPDHHANESTEEQAGILDKSATLNKAYKTFQDPDETIRYVLQLKELIEEEEKYNLPPDFLMEVMEINEAVMDRTGSNAELQVQIESLQQEIYEPVKKTIENYTEGVTTNEELLLVKEYYYKKKYIDRIRREINEVHLRDTGNTE